MNSQRLGDTLFGILIGIGLLSGASAFTNGGSRFESKSEFGACATGQNMALRDTAGTAIYIVRFKDGEVTTVKCSKQAIN